VASGYVGILTVELHFPESGSLKGKRKHLKSAQARLRERFGASVAEVDHHDLWQRSRLTVACAARGHRGRDVRLGHHEEVRLVAPPAGGVRVPVADQIDLVPLVGVGEVVIDGHRSQG